MLKIVILAAIGATLLGLARAQTKPQDVKNCKLNSSSLFSWVVQIWDEEKDGGAGTASIGSLITHRAVLTTAWYFSLADTKNNLNRYIVYGQNIWDYSKGPDFESARTNPCRQERRVLHIDLHPKTSKGQLGKLLFDFAVINLVKVFNVSSTTLPVMVFPRSPRAFLFDIQWINSLNPPYCVMPTPEKESNRYLVFNPKIKVSTLLFRTKCINYICEDVGKGTVSRECSHNLRVAPNGTMLCMIPEWTKGFEILSRPKIGDFPNYLAGTPLVCRGKTYGISPQVKRRAILDYKDFKQSFFFVITLLRVWKWLNSNILLYSVNPESYSIPPTPKAQEFYDPPAVSLDFELPTSPPTPKSQFGPVLRRVQTRSSASEMSHPAILKMSAGALQLLLTYF